MSDTRPIRLLIVDDHEVVRLGLRTMFEKHPMIQIVADAGTVADAVRLAQSTRPHVVLADVRMPQGGGVELCQQVKRLLPGVGVLFLTSFADDETIFNAISAGADGYLLKDVEADRLAQAITQVAGGQSILDPAVTRRVMGRLQSGGGMSDQNKLGLLSAQERRVLALVAEGKTNKEIAQALGLSDKTVKNYLANAMDKLKMSRRSQAAAFYVRNCG
jgi:two-component system, NarL family, response regulator DevR